MVIFGGENFENFFNIKNYWFITYFGWFFSIWFYSYADQISFQMIGALLLEIMPWFKTPVTVLNAMNLVIRILLILASALKDIWSMKLILLVEVYLMCCIFLGAIFNYFSFFQQSVPHSLS
ncbi:MAG: hypothetical protein CMG55_09665 [Candidatus Marinimicrobia bacterium]|nr:hypothetical protein [Candidatus Neomarinimicrobiota bacterium]|tara:strand:+ start:1478 stop:1840 length:363 start_codon:yes stop_codon:yes gene_type:complete